MQHKNEEYFFQLEKFIEDYWSRYGVSPTTGAIAKGTNIPYATVGRYLQYMREHDMIDYEGHRCYRTKKQLVSNSQSMQVPLLGHVACGVPKYAEENIEEYVSLPASLFGKGPFYLLRADGESMCILRRRVAAGALRVATRRYEWPALIRLLYVQS